VAALGYAQTFYMLPVSLFGMSIAAAELPELSRAGGNAAEPLRRRVTAGLRQMAVFVVPSAIGYLLLGDVIVGAMYQRGDFVRADTLLVYLILAGYSIGPAGVHGHAPLRVRALRAGRHRRRQRSPCCASISAAPRRRSWRRWSRWRRSAASPSAG
jgi:hypothetical protein